MRNRAVYILTLWVVLTAGGVTSAGNRKPKPDLTPEQAAVRDAIRRFAEMVKAKQLAIAPSHHIGKSLPKVKGCKLELISREELAARHKGEPKAPMIVAVTVYHPGKPGEEKKEFTVLVALEVAAFEGFDEFPDGIGREYIYRPTDSGAELVKEQGWVE